MSSITDPVAVARRLYDAIKARDPQQILDSMDEDFAGQVSLGMPLAVGGLHHGRDAMLREVWMPIFDAYEVRLDVERYLACGDEVVVIGHYRGSERAGGAEFAARFAHVLTVGENGIASLEQITDTASWATASPGVG